MPAEDILRIEITSRGGHQTGHHLLWVLEEEQIMRVALGKIQNESGATLTSRTSDSLKIIRSQRRDGDIQFGIQVSDVNTHLQGGGCDKAVYGVRVRTSLEVLLDCLSLCASQQSCVLVRIDPRSLVPSVYPLVISTREILF